MCSYCDIVLLLLPFQTLIKQNALSPWRRQVLIPHVPTWWAQKKRSMCLFLKFQRCLSIELRLPVNYRKCDSEFDGAVRKLTANGKKMQPRPVGRETLVRAHDIPRM